MRDPSPGNFAEAYVSSAIDLDGDLYSRPWTSPTRWKGSICRRRVRCGFCCPCGGMSVPTVDVIVVGGGPGGSTAAWRLARPGLRPLVLDAAVVPARQDLRGLGDARRAADLELEADKYPLTIQPFTACVLEFEAARHETGWRRPASYGIIRREFDHYLLERAAAAGADVRWGVRVTQRAARAQPGSVETDRGRLRGARGDRRGRPSLPGGARTRRGLGARGAWWPRRRARRAWRRSGRSGCARSWPPPSSTSSPICAATAGTSPSRISSTSASACTGGNGRQPAAPARRVGGRAARIRAGCPPSCPRAVQGPRLRRAPPGAAPARGPALLPGRRCGRPRAGSLRRGDRSRDQERERSPPTRWRPSCATGTPLDGYARQIVALYGTGEPGWLGRQIARLPDAAGRLAVRVVLGSSVARRRLVFDSIFGMREATS